MLQNYLFFFSWLRRPSISSSTGRSVNDRDFLPNFSHCIENPFQLVIGLCPRFRTKFLRVHWKTHSNRWSVYARDFLQRVLIFLDNALGWVIGQCSRFHTKLDYISLDNPSKGIKRVCNSLGTTCGGVIRSVLETSSKEIHDSLENVFKRVIGLCDRFPTKSFDLPL